MRMYKKLSKIASLFIALIIMMQIPFIPGKVNAAVNPGAGEFVNRLYGYALGRNPDSAGFFDWTNKLLYGQVNGAQVAEGILFSQEYIDRNTDDATYVSTLYHVFFDRDPDPTGLEVWTNALAQGAGRRDVMMGFVNSSEWANNCARAGIYSGSTASPDVQLQVTENHLGFINNLYRYFSSNGSGISDARRRELATDLLYLRTTCRQIASDIIFSSDYINVARNSTPGRVVTTFYKAFEGREPMPAENNALVNAMNGNINLDFLFNYFVNRQAFSTWCVNRGLMPGNVITVNTAGISDDAVRAYFADAAFVGNSVTAGFPMYFSANGSGLLGDVSVYARVSYSFLTDMNSMSGYMLQYDGVEMKAADLLALAGVRKVFICMGTNDLVGTEASVVRDRYINYINGIISANPGIRVFIVSTPPRVNSDQTPGLTNDKIDELNSLMSQYCSENSLDYIDINTALKNGTGELYSGYTSDGYVHMNNTGYGIWANEVSSYVRSTLAAGRHIYRYRGV